LYAGEESHGRGRGKENKRKNQSFGHRLGWALGFELTWASV